MGCGSHKSLIFCKMNNSNNPKKLLLNFEQIKQLYYLFFDYILFQTHYKPKNTFYEKREEQYLLLPIASSKTTKNSQFT